jgi:ABC-2 type transport system ATP-binding protein
MTAATVSTAHDLAVTGPAVLRLRGLTRNFGSLTAVDHVDLVAAAGEVIGLLGPNGSGKSTTLNMVLGYVRPTAGSVEIDGHDVSTDRVAALRSVGGLVEGSAFYPYLTGRQNLQLIARLRRLSVASVEAALDQVDMQRAADRPFGGYSQGMRQRLGVAAALIHNPQLIVLDEPTSGLDPAGTREMRALIPSLAEHGHTIVLASHLLNEVQQVCRSVAIMQEGRIIARGAVADLLRQEGLIRVTVAASQRENARSALQSATAVRRVTEQDGNLLVDAAGGGEAVNRALVAAGIYASEIARESSSLEDVFIALTETGGAP